MIVLNKMLHYLNSIKSINIDIYTQESSKLSRACEAGRGKRTHHEESLLAGYLFGEIAPHSQTWPE